MLLLFVVVVVLFVALHLLLHALKISLLSSDDDVLTKLNIRDEKTLRRFYIALKHTRLYYSE